MGMLAPLYALAALAIAGPILFHLIRRQPKGQVQFSSLMFLAPSPPRLTRRSRLDNLWLLLLRILAIVLIALAFARPYLRQDSFLNTTLAGRQIVVLFDTSGSMQRPDVWASAQQAVAALLDSLSPADRLAFYTIDSRLTPILAIDAEGTNDALASQQAVRLALDKLEPTWHTTALAEGLKSVADQIVSARLAGKIDAAAESEIVLISDLHNGSQLEALQGYIWPPTIRLDVRQILPEQPGNARPSLMESGAGEPSIRNATNAGQAPLPRTSDEQVRVRIENNSDSMTQNFRLAWGIDSDTFAEGATSFQVPAGQVRVVPLSGRPQRANRLVLQGDAWEADNSIFVAEPTTTTERIIYCGSAPSEPEDDLSYFLTRAPLSTPGYHRQVVKAAPEELPGLLAEPDTRAVVLEPAPEIAAQTQSLLNFAQRGGVVLICLSRTAGDATNTERMLSEILGVVDLRLSEAGKRDFALLSKIDFAHPVFAPLSDPRFNDFGKLRFWSHRRVEFSETSQLSDAASATNEFPVQIVARFDDQAPWLIDRSYGQGRIWLLTAGWQPTASGLGLSSKFIPILMGLLDPQGRTRELQSSYEVGEWIDVAGQSELIIRDATGRELDESEVVRQGDALAFQEPGLIWLEAAGQRRQIAVQVPASESRLTPIDIAQFEQLGIDLGKVASDDQRQASLRQMQVEELEGKQRLWQWLLAGCLALLGMETFLAGWLGRHR